MKTMHDLILAAQAGWEYRMEHGERLSQEHTVSAYICDTLHYQAHLGLDEQFGHLLYEVQQACKWICDRINHCFSVEQFIKNKRGVSPEGFENRYLFVDEDHPAVIAERRKIFAELLEKYPAEDHDGPGEEDGPWAEGWAERCGEAT